MQVVIFAKSSSDADEMIPTPEGMESIMRFHQELTDAGVLLGTGRLHSADSAVRVSFEGKSRTVTDGPFAEAKESVGGYWIWQVDSIDHAVEWLKKAPFDGGHFEIRQIAEMPEMAQAR